MAQSVEELKLKILNFVLSFPDTSNANCLSVANVKLILDFDHYGAYRNSDLEQFILETLAYRYNTEQMGCDNFLLVVKYCQKGCSTWEWFHPYLHGIC